MEAIDQGHLGESQLCTVFFLCLPHPHPLLDTTLKEEETLTPPHPNLTPPHSWAPAKDSCGKDVSLEVRPGSNLSRWQRLLPWRWSLPPPSMGQVGSKARVLESSADMTVGKRKPAPRMSQFPLQ